LLGHSIVPVDEENPFGQIKSARLFMEGFTVPIPPVSPVTGVGQLLKPGQMKRCSLEGSYFWTHLLEMYRLVVTPKRPQNPCTMATSQHNSIDLTPSENQILDAIKKY
jgi:hypothetical protein